MRFESLRIGDVVRAGPHRVEAADLAAFDALTDRFAGSSPTARKPEPDGDPKGGELRGTADLGAALATALWRVARLPDRPVSRTWEHQVAVSAGDEVALAATVVALRPERAGDRGLATWHCELTRADGVVVCAGESAASVPATPGAPRSVDRDVGTVAWGKALADELADDPAFASALASWDGAIGVRSGVDEVHLRVYRGRVIDVIRRSPLGASFVLGASRARWVDVLTGPPMEFAARQLRGEFETSGDPYEYLRCTKALALLVEAARRLAHDDGRTP